jgi:CubicO group peptidase (beta-lactamase class C family)
MSILPIFLTLLAAAAEGAPLAPLERAALPRATPESQGVSSRGIQAFVEAADRRIDTMNSFMLVRRGHVVAEGWWAPYNADSPHELYSLSKSFTSTAVGIAIGEGKLSVDDPVVNFFPDEAPGEPSGNLKAMRVSDLLRMSTGQRSEPPRGGEQSWVSTFLAHEVPFKPGTHFLYNTSATYMLSAIVQKATGETVLDYLRPRLFDPLGITNPIWGTSPQGVTLGGYGLSVRTEDIATFGQLYLQQGQWNGKQLVPKEWVEAATARQTSNGSNPNSDWDQGYGYQFWRCRNGAYRGDGAFGQYCIVLPEQDAVIAITSGVRDMQAVLNLVWEHLLPACTDSKLEADEASQKALAATLAGLKIKPQGGAAESPVANRVVSKTYRFDSNRQNLESIAVEPGLSGVMRIAVTSSGVERRFDCGHGVWLSGEAAVGGFPEQPIAASGAWASDHEYVAKICLYETPFILTLKFRFEGDSVTVDSETNVGFGPTKRPTLVGHSE